ncbi:MAG: CoA-binding protein [Candidatus Lokiarchaeota archaeon]|nr:CoA-binding protein [Candidatus Lokiarchaeota archaeon]
MTENHEKELKKDHFLYPFLNPRSLAVFGANNNLLTTMGSMQLRNIIAGGFNSNIYPVHPRLDNVQGFKAYKTVMDLPIIPDLGFLILPTRAVPQVMEECGEKGIKYLLITSGGFREIGEEGVKLSKKIDDIARKYNMRFIGPNCLGIYNAWYGFPEKEDAYFNTFWPYTTPKKGNISIISQSGTVAAQTFWHAREMGVNISKSISVGNERNIDMVDFLKYFKDDPQTEVIGLYIEEIKRGKEFIKQVKEITPKKPIVAIYTGGTKAANRSIKSHTGSLSGNQKIYDAVFKDSGIIPTNSITEFLYYLRTLSFAQKYNIFMKDKRVGIITNSGGSGSMMAKSLELYGLEVPEFSKQLKDKLSELIPSTANANNPIDVTYDNNFLNIAYKFPKMLMESGEVSSIIVWGLFDFDDILEIIEKSGMVIDENLKKMALMLDNSILSPIKKLMKKFSIPVFFSGPFPYRFSWFQKFISQDLPVFDFWDAPPKCLKVLYQYSEYRKKHSELFFDPR